VRVLEVTDFYYPWIAGPAPFIRNLSVGLAERGHDVVIACPSPTGNPYDEPDSPPRHRVRTFPVPFGYRLRAGFPLVDLARFMRSWRPDVVHIHHPFPISLAAVLSAKMHGIPVVATNHTIPECTLFGIRSSSWYRPAERALAVEIKLVLRSADAVTTPTTTAANMLRELGFRGAVTPISNGVDTTRFRPDPDTRTADIPTILYTGRLDDDKDMDTLIQALPTVLSQVDAKVRIGGEGTDRIRLERLVADMGLSRQVSFTGYVSDEDLPAVYREATVYCISSRVELQSISTLEAMASGLPVVAVDAGALPELIRPGQNGFLSPPGDSETFADAIVAVLCDRCLARRYGDASRVIAQGHSTGAMISQYERVLDDVALRGAPGRAYGAVRG